MPGTQGPDGQLRRSVSMTGWSKIKEDLTVIVNRSGGIQLDLPLPKSKSLVPVVTQEDEDETDPVVVVNEDIFPITEPGTGPKAFS